MVCSEATFLGDGPSIMSSIDTHVAWEEMKSIFYHLFSSLHRPKAILLVSLRGYNCTCGINNDPHDPSEIRSLELPIENIEEHSLVTSSLSQHEHKRSLQTIPPETTLNRSVRSCVATIAFVP